MNENTITRRQVGTGLLTGVAALATLSSASGLAASTSGGLKRWRHYATSRFGQVHLVSAMPTEREGDRPPLVCFHQSPQSGDYYREFQAEMATDRLVICPDTPGYGMSDTPPEPPTMADYGAAMADALLELGYGAGGKGPVDVLGFHTGNFVALELALQRPDLVRRMVMPGIPLFVPAARAEMLKKYANPRPYFSDPEFLADNYRNTVLARENGLSKTRLLDLFTDILMAGEQSWYGFSAVFRYEAEVRLAELDKPVFLPILNETLAQPTRDAGKLISGAEQVECPNLDNTAWFLAADQLAEIVRGFLDREE